MNDVVLEDSFDTKSIFKLYEEIIIVYIIGKKSEKIKIRENI